MKILVVSPYPSGILKAFKPSDKVDVRPALSANYNADDQGYDWIISYGCRGLFKAEWLAEYPDRIINIHIGFLPWNRGADPNLWSWLDNTTKGVTLHLVDSGIDTGPIIGQAEVTFNKDAHTLKTSYERLRDVAEKYFCHIWTSSLSDRWIAQPQNLNEGTTHKLKDKTEIMKLMPLGFNTPVREVEEIGEKIRCSKLESLASAQ